MTSAPFSRALHVADFKTYNGLVRPVFVFIKWDGDKLSISGVEGPKPNGDCHGSCGQCIPGPDRPWINPKVDLGKLKEVWERWHLNDMRADCPHQRAAGWADAPKIELITYELQTAAWSTQQAMKEDALHRLMDGETVTLFDDARAFLKLPISTTRPPDADSVGSGLYDVKKRETKAVQWVTPEEHPAGILGKPCPVCGYKYGSSWLKEEVPADVIEWLRTVKGGNAVCPSAWARG